jgi:mediator of RNA polymerase II transcription subunit 8
LLLRKRLEPDIVTWVNDARAVGVGLDAVDDGPAAESAADEMAMDVDREEGVGRLKSEDWAELWDWAAPAANQIAREVLLEPEEDDEDEDEEEEEEGSGHQNEKEAVNTAQKPQKPPDIPMMKLEDILKFSSTGFIPRGPKASRA